MTTGAACRGSGLAFAVIEINLPDGVRVRVDRGANEKALLRLLSRKGAEWIGPYIGRYRN
jgi:hypothetical protein